MVWKGIEWVNVNMGRECLHDGVVCHCCTTFWTVLSRADRGGTLLISWHLGPKLQSSFHKHLIFTEHLLHARLWFGRQWNYCLTPNISMARALTETKSYAVRTNINQIIAQINTRLQLWGGVWDALVPPWEFYPCGSQGRPLWGSNTSTETSGAEGQAARNLQNIPGTGKLSLVRKSQEQLRGN